jgi:hypothetical protein
MTDRQLALDCEPTWLDPEPDDGDDGGPWCRAPGLLPEQRDRTVTVIVIGDLL